MKDFRLQLSCSIYNGTKCLERYYALAIISPRFCTLSLFPDTNYRLTILEYLPCLRGHFGISSYASSLGLHFWHLSALLDVSDLAFYLWSQLSMSGTCANGRGKS